MFAPAFEIGIRFRNPVDTNTGKRAGRSSITGPPPPPALILIGRRSYYSNNRPISRSILKGRPFYFRVFVSQPESNNFEHSVCPREPLDVIVSYMTRAHDRVLLFDDDDDVVVDVIFSASSINTVIRVKLNGPKSNR